MSKGSIDATEIARAHASLGLTTEIADSAIYDRTVQRFRSRGIALPTFGELADPSTIPAARLAPLAGLDRNEPDSRNLFRVHWFGGLDGSGPHDVPDYIELPSEMTGVEARIVLAFGNRFPMIKAHKVLAAYACLVPRLMTGRFDPTAHRAVWPSTGNYARGGIAISRIMDCRGVAVLPEGMSKARFDWLEQWTLDPANDIIRTPGTESNVKEIYDMCNELEKDPEIEIINQFSEFSNHLGHYAVTGPALGRVFEHATAGFSNARLAAYVSASGSGGTLGAGDYLKDNYDARIVAVEALECPTLLENGFGDHNIQGIGDKHVPLIHNVMNTDDVVAVSDRSTDAMDALFNTPAGKAHLVDRVGLDLAVVDALQHLGYSSSCNALAAIKIAKEHGLGRDDVIVTVATDGSELYDAERTEYLAANHPNGYDAVAAAGDFGRELEAGDTAKHLELTEQERRRVFNLGYFTWVEQQGTDFADFTARADQGFWDGMRRFVAEWDEQIVEFNARTGTRDDD
ncbi:MAG: pyridoxal-phosphate dependent enzyme [Acidimicrobiales bacterium]|nr:pyridoxal-phosphate dependent enzyme [Acidimicrobiales bacterium]MDG2219032.1 pyridoxal-phosphate dependent enzyme [Acidimicrobiales bacterium]